MSVKRLLTEEFESELKTLEKASVGTDEYKSAIDGVTKLADRIIEIDKIERDYELKKETQLNEQSLKAIESENENRDRWIKNGLTAISTIGGLGLTAWAFVASMNFEKTGTLTTEGGKSALRQLLRFK